MRPQARLRACALLVAGCLVACGGAPAGAGDAAPPEPYVLYEEGPPGVVGSRLLTTWDVEVEAALRPGPLPESPAFARFLARVRAEYGADLAQRTLLARKAEKDTDDGRNAAVVLAAADTTVGPIGRFEAELLDRQIRRLDMVAHPSEFMAAVLRSKDGRRLRIFQYTVNSAGIGGVGRIRPHLDTALATGNWTFWVMLHNHNFFFEGPMAAHPEDRGGLVCPSAADARLIRAWRDELGLEEAWITNGVETGKYPAAMFDRFHAER